MMSMLVWLMLLQNQGIALLYRYLCLLIRLTMRRLQEYEIFQPV
jgi:hypothetical protein